MSIQTYQKARLARDRRFDGTFFVAVKTTKIFCRPICPANAPLEKNVLYFTHAIEAANAGFRPCLRCRPDSAPGSPAWQGSKTTFNRAIQLIKEGALQETKLENLALRLGVSDRYLRSLFKKHLGVSPKEYALYQQGLFAKQLLHQTKLPITQVALASGFGSVRRFNDYFKSKLHLTPSSIRKQQKDSVNKLSLQLSYRPPYNWEKMQRFFESRLLDNLEWCDENSYGRLFQFNGSKGYFTAIHVSEKCQFTVDIDIDDIRQLKAVIANIRRILDLDADISKINQDLCSSVPQLEMTQGLRLPGTWSLYEAGIRAILGQQISVSAAKNLLYTLIDKLGEKDRTRQGPARNAATKKDQATNLNRLFFPTADAIFEADLTFLKIPMRRQQTLKDFALFYLEQSVSADRGSSASPSPSEWLNIKGIGPWTVDYAKMRGLSDPDIYLESDLGVKNAIKQLKLSFSPEDVSPWGSYLTLQLWDKLS